MPRALNRSVRVAAAAVFAFTGASQSQANEQLQPFLHGATFGAGQYGNPNILLTATEADESLQRLAAAGANAVAIPVVWYVNATNATELFPMPGSNGSPLRTVTDAELAHAVQLAHELRLSVTMQLVLDLNWDLPNNLMSPDPVYAGAACLFYGIKKSLNLPVPPQPPVCPSQPTSRAFIGCGAVDGGGAASLDCVAPFSSTQWDAWFLSYQAFAVRYAALAQQWGVEWLGVSSGLDTAHSTAGQARWQSLLAAVRGVFSGRLTASAAVTSSGANGTAAGLGAVAWWNATDAVGVELLVPLDSNTADVDELVAAWAPTVAALQQFSSAVGRPVLVTRWGYQSRNAAWAHPAGAPRYGEGADCSVYMRCSSMAAQVAAYEAFFRAFLPTPAATTAATTAARGVVDGGGGGGGSDGDCAGWLAGAFLWLWRNDPSQGGTSGDDFTPAGKPALAVATRYWTNSFNSSSNMYSTITSASASVVAGKTSGAAAAALLPGAATPAATVVSTDDVVRAAFAKKATPLQPGLHTFTCDGWTRQHQHQQQQQRKRGAGGATKQNGICFGIGEWSSTESPSADLNSSEARQSLLDAVAHGVNR
jgi:hypothetical protein